MRLTPFRAIAGISVVVIVLCAVAAVKPLFIAYHRQKMVEHDRWFWDGAPAAAKEWRMGGVLAPQLCEHSSVIDPGFWHHRKRLMAWGAIDSIDYTFQHIESTSPEFLHLWDRIQSNRCPEYDHEAGAFGSRDSLGSSGEPEPARVIVSCSPALRESWLNFLKSVDVEDYLERFTDAPKRTEPRWSGKLKPYYWKTK